MWEASSIEQHTSPAPLPLTQASSPAPRKSRSSTKQSDGKEIRSYQGDQSELQAKQVRMLEQLEHAQGQDHDHDHDHDQNQDQDQAWEVDGSCTWHQLHLQLAAVDRLAEDVGSARVDQFDEENQQEGNEQAKRDQPELAGLDIVSLPLAVSEFCDLFLHCLFRFT